MFDIAQYRVLYCTIHGGGANYISAVLSGVTTKVDQETQAGGSISSISNLPHLQMLVIATLVLVHA